MARDAEGALDEDDAVADVLRPGDVDGEQDEEQRPRDTSYAHNAIETIEGAVAFYDGDAFNKSPAGLALKRADPRGVGIELDGTQIVAVAAFLRVVNALENIRESLTLLEASLKVSSTEQQRLLERAARETADSARVLAGGGLHPEAVARLQEAGRLVAKAIASQFFKRKHTERAIREHHKARALLVESS